MTHLRFLIPTLALFILTLSHCGGSDSSPPSTSPTTTSSPQISYSGKAGDGVLSEQLNTIITNAGRPAIAAFSLSEGQVIEMEAVGLRSADSNIPVTSEDLWHVGSIGKSMTATLVAFMVDAGFLTWETSVNEAFPEWSDTTLSKYGSLQIQELLSHTSGLEDEFPTAVYDLLESDLSGPEVRYLGSQIALSYDHNYNKEVFRYANLNYVLAAAMLEKVSGRNWRDLITEYVFHPLGIYEFGFGLPGEPGTLDQPTGHFFNIPGDAPIHAAVGPAGSMHFSLDSMAIYANFHLQGLRGEGSMLSRDSYEKLYQPRIPSRLGGDYALGWVRNNNRIYHAGTNGRWFAHLEIDGTDNTAYFAVSNSFSDGFTVSMTPHGPIEIFISETLNLLKERVENLSEED